MNIRNAEPGDLSAIIDLLRISLGDGSTEKSTEFWRWKHEANPFGPSPVLVAEDEGRLAGVRAFMRWKWKSRTGEYRALRAVDTATHPDYRGRGIFKTLTRRLIEDCKAAGDDFIFNTPNEQSRPGYLKMGWEQVGKLPVRLAPVRPVSGIANMLGGAGTGRTLDLGRPDYTALEDSSSLDWLTHSNRYPTEGWWTPKSVQFLRWRYADCPAREYHLAGDPENFLIFYYGRQQKIGTELRVVDYLVRPGAEAAARAALRKLNQTYRPDVITAAPVSGLPWFFLPAFPLGLILTYRELNTRAPARIENWNYAIGDLELF